MNANAMDDMACPKCMTTMYRNPNMELMVNVCGHNLCRNCVELLFAKGSEIVYASGFTFC